MSLEIMPDNIVETIRMMKFWRLVPQTNRHDEFDIEVKTKTQNVPHNHIIQRHCILPQSKTGGERMIESTDMYCVLGYKNLTSMLYRPGLFLL